MKEEHPPSVTVHWFAVDCNTFVFPYPFLSFPAGSYVGQSCRGADGDGSIPFPAICNSDDWCIPSLNLPPKIYHTVRGLNGKCSIYVSIFQYYDRFSLFIGGKRRADWSFFMCSGTERDKCQMTRLRKQTVLFQPLPLANRA